ncbi:DUF1985 domain-containing protein [Abeliophyllum distichum]|uniref:DUF1985 domain-containing protein n=1 Tax=Abeliophyllum distichum TaxID=126358 RepID=A0ABD1PV97_9LAMI
MEYAVDRRLCDFPGKVNANFNITNIKRVENALDKHYKAMLRQSFFWKFHQVRRMQFSGQIIDNLLLRLLKSENIDELWFRLGDNKVARFSFMEFLILTGLNAGNEDEVKPNIQRSKRLLNKYFNSKTTVTPVELESTFDACTVMKDKYKLGLVYILETMLRCKHHKTSIDLFCLDIVDDIEVFNAYPWGCRCFMDTLHAFKRMHTIKGSKTDRKYDIYGFPLAVQVWAFEAIPMLADKWDIRKDWTRIPRMLNWQATDIPTAKDVATILDDPQLEVYTILTPTPEEMENVYIQGFYIPARVPDPILDLYLVREEEHSPTAQKSPTEHQPSPSSPPPRLSHIPSPDIRQSCTTHSGSNVSEDLFERLNSQSTSMEHRITSQLMTEIRHLNKKVDEVIEWVRPLHYTDTMAPETTSDRVPIESDRMRDQEVNMEMETTEIPEF